MVLYIARASSAMNVPISSGIFGKNICEEEEEVNLQKCFAKVQGYSL
jgi:hypothetical protein